MDSNEQNQPQMSMKNLDNDTRENILKLDQKLRGLRAEIEAKLERPSLYSGDNPQEFLDKLVIVSKEINDAINGIDTLVNLINSNSDTESMSFHTEEEIRDFSEMIATNLEKITEIKKEF